METLVLSLHNSGMNVFVLTTCVKGKFHEELERKGINTFSINSSSVFSGIKKLIGFCKKYSISTIHSHLQATNIIAVLAQYFLKAKVVVFRHHFELPQVGMARNRNEKLGEKLINRLAKQIIVPSSGVYNGINDYENINMKRLAFYHICMIFLNTNYQI